MQNGVVKWFNSNKGYGFIEPQDKSKDIFLHSSALQEAGIQNVEEGQRVSFNIENKNGKISAVNIKLL